MDYKQKILLCGDVEGRFNTLFSRVENIIKKSGQFDLLLCVGNFFGINNKEFDLYKLGTKKVPVATYILGPNKEDNLQCYPEDESELCENVYYLGKRGLYTSSKGLKIAYLSGVYNENSKEKYNYSKEDVTELCDICVKGNASFRGVDILLTSQWPNNIVKDNPKETIKTSYSTDLISWLVMKIKPRYIVSGMEGIYYERPPFRCPNLGDHDPTLEIVTRFIGLARVGNPNKAKWLYALNVIPLNKMKIADLVQKTIDETACPYNFSDLESTVFDKKRSATGSMQFFYDTSAKDEDGAKKKYKKQKVEFDQSKCWFCLASPSVEKHLIITVGTFSYLALAKGGIVEEHFLICPIEHYQSSLGHPNEVAQEIKQFKEALRKFYGRRDQVPVFFERNYKTSHMQLQAIPIPKRAVKELKEIFIEEAEAQNIHLEELESHNRLDQVVPQGVPYFVVELPNGETMYTKIQGSSSFPLNFTREVLATGPILNLSDRTDWKDCIVSKEKEEKLVQRIRTDFEPFDFSIE